MLLRSALAVACLSLAACGSGLADRPAFQGEVAITVGGQEHRGRLTWARPAGAPNAPVGGTLQFDATRDGHAENVSLVPPAQMVAFRDGVPRAMEPDEQRLLAGLAAIFGWPAPLGDVAPAVRVPGRDAARGADGSEVAVTVVAERPPGPHGR